jgi:hypothetical protein
MYLYTWHLRWIERDHGRAPVTAIVGELVRRDMRAAIEERVHAPPQAARALAVDDPYLGVPFRARIFQEVRYQLADLRRAELMQIQRVAELDDLIVLG